MNPEAIALYFEGGALIDILRRGLGGNPPPRAWLRRVGDQITHTFIEELGERGGEPIPFFTVENNRIVLTRVEEVEKYLTTFGLDERLARRVVATVNRG